MSIAAVAPVTYGHDAALAKFSVARYQRMIEAGILTADDKVELLENYVVLKMPRNPPHDGTIDLVSAVLSPAIPKGWLLRCQQAIVLLDSQPEPDFAIVRGTPRSYLTRHPSPPDIGLVVEVADASLLRDRRDKTRIYGRADIPSYWIVNLVDRLVEVYWQPTGPVGAPSYQSHREYRSGEQMPLELEAGRIATIDVDDMLP